MKIEGGITIDSIHVQPSPETSKLMPRIAHLPSDPIKPTEEVISYDQQEYFCRPESFYSLKLLILTNIPIFHSQPAAKQPTERDPNIAKLPICYGYMLVKF